MENKNGKRNPADLLAVLRMMYYITRELQLMGYSSEAADVNAAALKLQKQANITDEQLVSSPSDDGN